jgi:hypothetical protein
MGRPFLRVRIWREFKTPAFNSKVMLIVILEFGNYRVRFMINKPTELSVEWLPKMPLLSSNATLFVNFVADGRKKRFTHTRDTF